MCQWWWARATGATTTSVRYSKIHLANIAILSTGQENVGRDFGRDALSSAAVAAKESNASTTVLRPSATDMSTWTDAGLICIGAETGAARHVVDVENAHVGISSTGEETTFGSVGCPFDRKDVGAVTCFNLTEHAETHLREGALWPFLNNVAGIPLIFVVG